MSKENKEAPEIEYLRKRDNKFVYHATKILIARGDLFPCDANGNFMTTGRQTLNVEHAADKAPDPRPDTSDDEDNTLILAMIARAKQLGIKNPHTMKEDTLARKIAEVEAGEQKEEDGE